MKDYGALGFILLVYLIVGLGGYGIQQQRQGYEIYNSGVLQYGDD